MKRIFALILTLSSIAFSIISCGQSYDPTEIKTALETLAPRAYELYMIVYSDAIAHKSEPESNGYYIVTDPELDSLEDIDLALKEVFTAAYARIIGNTAFTGVSADEGAIGPKFSMNMDGKLTVKPSVTEDFGLPREFDLSTVEIIKQNRYQAIIQITPINSEEPIKVTLQKVSGEWRIDSPLY